MKEQQSKQITELSKLSILASDRLKQITELKELLKIAQCPNNCDDGSIAHGSNETGWEQEQCQFCDERKQALNQ